MTSRAICRKTPRRLVAVGHRLATKLETHPDLIARLDGPTATEDVPAVLGRLMDAVHAAIRPAAAGLALYGLARAADGRTCPSA